MAEETKEGNVAEFPNRLASPEFFYLLERIDRVGEKLTDEIRTVGEHLCGEIRTVRGHLCGEIGSVSEHLSGEINAMGAIWIRGFKWQIGLLTVNLILNVILFVMLASYVAKVKGW